MLGPALKLYTRAIMNLSFSCNTPITQHRLFCGASVTFRSRSIPVFHAENKSIFAQRYGPCTPPDGTKHTNVRRVETKYKTNVKDVHDPLVSCGFSALAALAEMRYTRKAETNVKENSPQSNPAGCQLPRRGSLWRNRILCASAGNFTAMPKAPSPRGLSRRSRDWGVRKIYGGTTDVRFTGYPAAAFGGGRTGDACGVGVPGRGGAAGHQPELKATGWAAATVLNFLYRLEEKGWVRSAKQGNCNVYVPLVTRRAYGVYCMRQRLDTLFDGDLAAAVHALVSEAAAPRAPWSRPSGCWRRSIRRPRSTICTTPTVELFYIFYKMLVDSEISVL